MRVIICSGRAVSVWGADNHWEAPYKILKGYGRSIELLSRDLLLRGLAGEIQFIDYIQSGRLCPQPSNWHHNIFIIYCE